MITKSDVKSFENAIKMIKENGVKRVDLGNNTIIYKVPSNNPSKYTIRMDIKVEE